MKIIVMGLILLLCSCQNILLAPSERIHRDQLQKYLHYVEEDPNMSERDKQYQRDLVDRYGELLKELRK